MFFGQALLFAKQFMMPAVMVIGETNKGDSHADGQGCQQGNEDDQQRGI
jgi:hypothetical protein